MLSSGLVYLELNVKKALREFSAQIGGQVQEQARIKNMFLQQCTEDQRAVRQSGELRMISEKWSSSSKKVHPGFWSLVDRGSEQVDDHKTLKGGRC